MLIDLHTHTRPLSYDSALDGDELIDAAKQSGLDGVCLTEHDFFWEPGKVDELRRRHGFLVLAGIEVNTENGHIIVFGLDKYVYGMHRLAELGKLVEASGGAMIAAHPYRRQLPFHLEREGDWTEALERAAANDAYARANALEAHNGRGSERQNAFSRAVCDRLRLQATAGSDAHHLEDVGICATEFDANITSRADLIRELKMGKYRPVVLRGKRQDSRRIRPA